MNLSSLLRDTTLGRARIVAGRASLDHEVLWVQIIDHPDIADWVQPGHLLLMTGYHWPKTVRLQQALVRKLQQRGLAAIVLAVPRFLAHFPDDVCKTADTIGLPLLEIPWEVPFSQLTEEIHGRIITHQQQLLARADEIHRSLTRAAATGSDLRGLARLLARHLDCAISFVSKDGLLLGTSLESGNRVQMERDYHEARRSGNPPRSTLAGEAFEAVGAPGTEGALRLGCAILVHDEVRAMAWLDRTQPGFTDLDRRAIEHGAMVAALHLVQIEAIEQREEQLGYALLESLLDGSFANDALSLERARVAGWEPSRPYRVALLRIRAPDYRSDGGLLKRIAYWRRRVFHQLQSGEAPRLTLVQGSNIFFLLPGSTPLQDFWSRLGSSAQIALAASREVCGAAGIALARADVTELVPYLAWNRAITFEEVLLPRVLSGDGPACRMFVQERLGALLRLPDGDPLLATLVALGSAGFQLNKTATHLGIHINTLRYRVAKIQELVHGAIDDGRFRFELQLALELWGIHKAEWQQGAPPDADPAAPDEPANQ